MKFKTFKVRIDNEHQARSDEISKV